MDDNILVGRPSHKPTNAQREQVEQMAGVGITHQQIACILDINRQTLAKHYRKELDRGKSIANLKVASALFTQATSGNITAMIFWLKTQAGWKEKEDVKEIETNNILYVNKPPDITREEWIKIYSNNTKK